MNDIESQINQIKILLIIYLLLFIGGIVWFNHKFEPITAFIDNFIIEEHEDAEE